MGKDKEGRFHPKKGRPTAEGEKKGIVEIDHTQQQDQIALEERLGIDPDNDIQPSAGTRHPNRNKEKHYDHAAAVNGKSGKRTKQPLVESVGGDAGEGGFSRSDFDMLATFRSDICISIYLNLNTQLPGEGSRVDAMLFKTTLQNLAADLQERRVNQAVIATLLEPAYAFLRMEAFTTAPAAYAVFIAHNLFKWVALPYPVKEYSLINGAFYVSPLVQLLAPREKFYVLTISKKQARMFEGDQFMVRYVDIPDLPDGIADVVHVEEKDDERQFRSGTGDGSGYHDVVSGSPDEKETLALYLRDVDNTLWKARLANEHVPLVLAGVDYVVNAFRQLSHYRHIWKESISGNHDHDNMRELHRIAKNIVKSHFDQIVHQALNEFGNRSASGSTSIAISEIIQAAWFARVGVLFVADGEEIWGRFDPERNQADVHSTRERNDDNLIDLSISRTLMNGGEVHFLEKEKMPKESKIAAILRF